MDTKYNYYIKNINKVIDFIDRNIGKSYSLQELSAISNFSKYHFHRIFCSLVGEPLFQYILRLRLEKCASVLALEPKRKLSDIALHYGFSDLSIFSRHFKKQFGVSPSSYRAEFLKKSNYSQTNSNIQRICNCSEIYLCPELNTNKWTNQMEIIKRVEVQNFSAITVAYIRNFGAYAGNSFSYEKSRNELFAWAISKDLMNKEGFKYLIVYHDNPSVALNDKLRMSLCVTIPENFETDGVVGKMGIDGGKYLVCECELTTEDFPKAWEWIYRNWFPNSNYIPDDKPYFELYKEQPQGNIHKVSFCIPVKVRIY